MLSDEEKKAIEEFKKLKDYKYIYYGYIWYSLKACADDEMKRNIDIILNLIEKQQKEIEELKEDNKHQWEERCKLIFELENSTSNDKIKAKIEEIKQRREKDGECELALHEFQREAKIEVLQSLIEKE